MPMQQAKRFFLIPEELYESLNSPSDGTALGLVKARMEMATNDHLLNKDQRALQYEQEFKRYNKLVREEEERPVKVKIENPIETPPSAPPPKKIGVSTGTKRGYRIPKKVRVKRSIKNLNLRERIMNYVRSNAQSLGVDIVSWKVMRTIGPNAEPFVTSNVHELIGYLLRNGWVRRKPLPVGYEEFVRRVHMHPKLEQMIVEEQQSEDGDDNEDEFKNEQGGSGYGKTNKKNFTSFPVRFRPTLWAAH